MNKKAIRLKEISDWHINDMFRNQKPKDEKIILNLRIYRNPLTSQFLLNFDSISEASKRLNINKSQIINQLKGRTKHVRGLIFEYVK